MEERSPHLDVAVASLAAEPRNDNDGRARPWSSTCKGLVRGTNFAKTALLSSAICARPPRCLLPRRTCDLVCRWKNPQRGNATEGARSPIHGACSRSTRVARPSRHAHARENYLRSGPIFHGSASVPCATSTRIARNNSLPIQINVRDGLAGLY